MEETGDGGSDPVYSRFLDSYVRCLYRSSKFVLVAWVMAAATLGVLAPRFLANTTNTFTPGDQAPSSLATTFEIHHGDAAAGGQVVVLYVTAVNSLLAGGIPATLIPLSDATVHAVGDIANDMGHNPSSYSVQSYSTATQNGSTSNPMLSRTFLSKDERATVLIVTIDRDVVHSAIAFSTALQSRLERQILPSLQHTPSGPLRGQCLGYAAFLPEIMSSVDRDMALCDGIAIPTSLLILGCVLRSWRLLLLPLLSLALTCVTSFGLMYFVTLSSLSVMSTTLSLMTTVSLALSLDYGLFLSSYLQENTSGTLTERVRSMLFGAGHTISVSGLTLFAAFVGIVVVPLDSLRGLGLGAGIATLCALTVNLCFVPTVLLQFPRFFSLPAEESSISDERTSVDAPVAAATSSIMYTGTGAAAAEAPHDKQSGGDTVAWPLLSSAADSEVVHNGGDGSQSPSAEAQYKGSCWLRLGRCVTRFPYNVLTIILVLGATAFLVPWATHFPLTGTMYLALPQHAAPTVALRQYLQSFGSGTLNSYTLILEAAPGQDVVTDTFFSATRKFVMDVLNQMNPAQLSCTDITGLSLSYCIAPFNASIVQKCLSQQAGTDSMNCVEVLSLYRVSALPAAIGMTPVALRFHITPHFDAIGPQGRPFYHTLLSAARESESVFRRRSGGGQIQRIYVGGGNEFDQIDVSFRYFPLMVTVAACAIAVVMGVAFKSVLIPLRAALTVAATLVFSYGMATAVYVHGGLEWTGFEGFSRHGEDALLWMPPLVSFSILCGLAIDYDSFLLVRIYQFRQLGYSTREAIARGLGKSGSVISAAGIIMTASFSGLLFSSTPAMNQLAFYLCSAVLYDTFIVRPFLAPALFSIAAEYNWWPGVMSPVTHR